HVTPQPSRHPAEGNAWAIAQGKQLYEAYNCNGCHANGGGGMGPALMDATWLYGSEPQDVYTSIVEGRPNGMPAFGGRIPDVQVWQLVAYVRSMSGQTRFDVRPARSDHMRVKESEQARRPARPGRWGSRRSRWWSCSSRALPPVARCAASAAPIRSRSR